MKAASDHRLDKGKIMKKHKPMSEEEYKSLLPSEKEIEKTMNELKESLSSHNPEASTLDSYACIPPPVPCIPAHVKSH